MKYKFSDYEKAAKLPYLEFLSKHNFKAGYIGPPHHIMRNYTLYVEYFKDGKKVELKFENLTLQEVLDKYSSIVEEILSELKYTAGTRQEGTQLIGIEYTFEDGSTEIVTPHPEVKKLVEDILMAHRYLYYVLNSPVISDYDYDMLEKEFLKDAPIDSPIQRPGSDLESSYTIEQKEIAGTLLNSNHGDIK